MARGFGLDVQSAESAVRTLQGDELQRLSLLASDASGQLAGGDRTISISLVAALLIVIIIILVAD
jgi:predicted ATPase